MIMKRAAAFWILAFVVTIASAIYQRMTGPTYPVSGKVVVGGKTVVYRFLRSHDTSGDAPVEVATGDSSATGIMEWKRYKSSDPWMRVPMSNARGTLSASLPRQPAAGKLEYMVMVTSTGEESMLPKEGGVVLRFKGEVPAAVLIVHIFCMFSAMLLSARTGLEFFNPEPKYRRLIPWTIGFLAVGGLILGPIVQKFAFDAYWTGWPFGHDLTDNKTIVALLGWIVAAWMLRRGRDVRAWALGAAILVMAVYMVPHSVLGSELDYSKVSPASGGTKSQRPPSPISPDSVAKPPQ
jgi:hypothetical protein